MIPSVRTAPLLLGALILAVSGCVEMGPPPASATFPTSFEPIPVAKALPTSFTFDPDDLDDSNLGDTLGGSNKVVIPRFTVTFVMSGAASARTSEASANMEVFLTGIDLRTMQAITDAAYADFVAQLKATGREVVSVETMRATQSYHAFDFYDPSGQKHYLQEPDWTTGLTGNLVTVNPTGLPMWFEHGEGNKGLFDQGNGKAMNALSAELQAVVVTPNYVIDFAKFESSGRGVILGGGANVGVEPLLHLGHAVTPTLGQTIFKATLAQNAMGGAMGYLKADEWVFPPKGGDGFALSLDKTGGTQDDGYWSGHAHSRGSYVLKANPAIYKQLALACIQAVNAAYMKPIKDNAP
ncbi:MAG: hypothetical protein COX57_03950 [Alphaproteobacteria bacterium CG_4_10_14_0_2_um_filter_63_37]|nr:MAG: hypothetical protein COX57_03950 [Alphaproteobacteria bacterium CG_4_10_14_0_2_um_filter_63_37]